MNDLAALSGTPAILVLGAIRVALTFAMLFSLIIRNASVRGSRRRYRAATILRTTVIPVTILATVQVAVDAAAGYWANAIPNLLLLALMPLYFRFANDDDNWWTGRWTKIRKGITAALGKTAPAPVAQH